MKLLLDPKCSCIVPFYNEKIEDISYVLDKISRVRNIKKIICIDDGSSNKSIIFELKKKYKSIVFVRMPKNEGKSHAVAKGLSLVKTEFVLMMDSDLSNIKHSEIEKAVECISKSHTIDMVILRIINFPWYAKLIRGDVLTSGQRILRTEDLREVISGMRPQRYQLEYAINFFMMKNNKKSYWMPYSAKNFTKVKKRGFIRGLSEELSMYKDMLRYVGVFLPLKSLLFFSKSQIKLKKE